MSETLNATWFIPPVIQRIAELKGYLLSSDVEINGEMTRSSDQQFEALCDGRRDVAVTAMDNVIHWNRRSRGGDFRIIAQVEADTGNTLVAQAEIASIGDLAGKRLLVDSAENGFVVVLRALLADAGVDFDACKILRVGGVKERFDAIVAGDGDATLLGPPFVDLSSSLGLRQLAQASTAYPDFPGQGIVVREALLANRGDVVRNWLVALEQARAECRQEPRAVAAYLEAGGLPLNSATRLASFVGESLIVGRAGIDLLIEQRQRLGLIGGDTRIEDLVDRAPLDNALVYLKQREKDSEA